jgi:hypothetical protein
VTFSAACYNETPSQTSERDSIEILPKDRDRINIQFYISKNLCIIGTEFGKMEYRSNGVVSNGIMN